MRDAEISSAFRSLFLGNPRAVGAEDGGCVRIDGIERWRQLVVEHLTGETSPIGVYPMVQWSSGDWCVHFGVVDFDEGEEESWIHAQNLSKVLTKFGVTPWMERSRSKGYHVWVFDRAGGARSAALVRRGLFVACQLAQAPTKEVNPKQETLLEGQLGNYIRLPYPGWLGSHVERPSHRVMLTLDYEVIPLVEFVQEATRTAGLDGLETLAKMYVEKKKLDVGLVEYDAESSTVNEDLVQMLPRRSFVIWRDGPLDGSDRSSTLYRLASIMAEDGVLDPDEALTLLRDADARWGKQFESRPGGLKYLAQIIEKTFDVTLEVE